MIKYSLIRYLLFSIGVLLIQQLNAYDVETALALPNAYMIKPGESVSIPVTKAFAVWENVSLLKNLNEDLSGKLSTELLWQDNSGLISSLNLNGSDEDAVIVIQSANVSGNAVVALKIGGNVRWSWHIWVTDYDPDSEYTSYTYNNQDVAFMNMNLGAVSNDKDSRDSYGLLYQYGRKDAFVNAYHQLLNVNYSNEYDTIYDFANNNLTSNSVTEIVTQTQNLKNAIENPLTYYLGTSTNDWYSSETEYNDSLWLGTNGAKGIFDPSPEGWRVPSSNLLQLCVNDSANLSTFSYSGSRDYTNGSLFMTGLYGMYWTSTTNGSLADYLFLSDLINDATSAHYRANAYAIRCVKCSDDMFVSISDKEIETDDVTFDVFSENKSVTVKVETVDLGCEVSVYTINGICIARETMTLQQKVVANNLVSGIYLVRLKGSINQTTKVFIK